MDFDNMLNQVIEGISPHAEKVASLVWDNKIIIVIVILGLLALGFGLVKFG